MKSGSQMYLSRYDFLGHRIHAGAVRITGFHTPALQENQQHFSDHRENDHHDGHQSQSGVSRTGVGLESKEKQSSSTEAAFRD